MIVIGFGANLSGRYGAPEETFQHALAALSAQGISVLQSSSLWKTSPVGTADEQDWYTNAVIEVETAKSGMDILTILLDIEAEFGRVRSIRNAARSIDLDLICYHDEIMDDQDRLVVPHPRMHERGFVLLPLQEIAPEWVHPVSGVAIEALVSQLPDDQQAERITGQAA